MSKNRIGDVIVIENTQPISHFAARTYNYVRIQLPGGEETAIMLTDKELGKGIARAKKNPEDAPKVSFLRDALD